MQISQSKALTLGELIKYLAPELAAARRAPFWPPDAFALAASILQRSGGYRAVLGPWPPEGRRKGSWSEWIDQEVAGVWRRGLGEFPESPKVPRVVQGWWKTIRQADGLALSEVARDRELCHALLQLCAAADAASAGAGVPVRLEGRDAFWRSARRKLERTSKPSSPGGASLCTRRLRPWAVRVLPKLHTPQAGITIRSLSHHLSLASADEVLPRWVMPVDFSHRPDPRMLNLLVVPWPLKVERHQFKPVPSSSQDPENMPPSFGFFAFRKINPRPLELRRELASLYAAARREADFIDLVVLPELALNEEELQEARQWAAEESVLLIAGVGRTRGVGEPEENFVALEVPFIPGTSISIEQPKHHRWQLDRSQIEAYGLAGHLNPSRRWWEYTRMGDRSLYFLSLLPWFTLCVLVCEDLAQQEPVAKIVRAVGPNLVIAVLMDGPQLGARWPGRYATALADDPGSSVLTVTSLGMCERSVPPGKSPSRVVALWKDRSGQRELTLGPKASGLVLNLLIEPQEEWTADGRTDNGDAGLPVLVGAHDVVV